MLWFDAALIGYLFGIMFMVFGVAYRYSAASHRMRDAIDLDPLGWLPGLVLVVSGGAWLAVFVGLLHHLVAATRSMRSRPSD